MSIAPILDIMSKLMYVKKLVVKKEEGPTDKPLTTNHRTLMLTIVFVVGLSILIGVGSGHYSTAYVLCRNEVLSQVSIGAYRSADEITAALGSCDGVTS